MAPVISTLDHCMVGEGHGISAIKDQYQVDNLQTATPSEEENLPVKKRWRSQISSSKIGRATR
jgi:hypothetical protein